MKIALLILALAPLAFAKIPEKRLEVQGHRGARWVKPENTLPAFQYALETGVDTLELDMVVTKDNQVVVSHDPHINKDICLDADGKRVTTEIAIRTLTLEQLKKYDCGSLVNPRFKEQQVVPKTPMPTLDEVFQLVEKSKLPVAKRVLFNIETKSEEAKPELTPTPEEFVKLVLAVVQKHKMLKRVTLQSFDFRTLKAAKTLEPKLSLPMLLEDRPKEEGTLVKLVKEYNASVLSPHFEWLTAQDVQDMHKLGVKVMPWTANTANDWKKLIAIGVDGIITDNPKELINFLKNPTPPIGEK